MILRGRYRLVRVVKSGAMGAVHEALDGDERVAVKELRVDLGREADVLRRLDMKGIPRVRDAFREGERQYLVMDYIEGPNLLEDLARRGRPYDAEEAVETGLQALDILEYLHSRTPPLVHRDVKPANLIREASSGTLFLVDFGLVREAAGGKQTQIGTAGYCPAEQAYGVAVPASDLYALGATLFHLLRGAPPPPFRYVPLVRHRRDLPSSLMDAVATAMAPRPQDRFRDAEAFRQALRAVRENPAPPALQDDLSRTGEFPNPHEILARHKAGTSRPGPDTRPR